MLIKSQSNPFQLELFLDYLSISVGYQLAEQTGNNNKMANAAGSSFPLPILPPPLLNQIEIPFRKSNFLSLKSVRRK